MKGAKMETKDWRILQKVAKKKENKCFICKKELVEAIVINGKNVCKHHVKGN